MKSANRYTALLASLLLVMPLVAYSDQGSSSQYVSQRVQIAMAAVTCKNTEVTGILNDVVTAINNPTITATLSTDISKVGADFSTIQADSNSNNISKLRTDVANYNHDTKTANLDARAAIKADHNKSVNTTMRSEISQLSATYRGCIFAVKQQMDQLKLQMYAKSISRAQNMTNKLGSHGANTTALGQTISAANSQIQAYETAVNSAQNGTQLQAALKSFCLYNGCKGPNDFHFAAKVALDANLAKLSLLASKNTTASFQTLVGQAQTDLGKAQAELNQIGSNQYQGTQSSDIWNNIKAAADIIHHLQQIVNHRH